MSKKIVVLEDGTFEYPKYEIFCQSLAAGKTPEDAHRAAGYKASRQGAHNLLQKPEIRARIAAIKEELNEKLSITKEKVVNEVASILFSDRSSAGTKLKSAEVLAKLLGYNAATESKITHKKVNDIDELTDAELQAMLHDELSYEN